MTYIETGKIPVAVLGATGMVGQRVVTLLENHPWFETTSVAASPQSRGKRYEDAVKDRWYMEQAVPSTIAGMQVLGVEDDITKILDRSRIVFCALDMEKERIQAIEDAYASGGVAVVSNNSAHRWTPDVPMMIPEVNPQHADVIVSQREKRGWKKGSIAVKSNCSIQSFVPILDALKSFGPKLVSVVTSQALSGAGKTRATWSEMDDNIIPFIKGEEEKTEKEPLKIWGVVENGIIQPTDKPIISATCTRVPISDGHMAMVSVLFERRPTRDEIIDAFNTYNAHNVPRQLNLPSSPDQFIIFHHGDDRPQTRLDRSLGKGMSISVGRLREDPVLNGWKFVGLSHNTIRGAAGGAIETAELLYNLGYIQG